MSSSSNHSRGNGSTPALELPLLALPTTHPCKGCGACCRYIAIEIDSPTGYRDYDHIYWYLVHRNVSVYIDWEGDWFVEFQTVCEHLTDASTCGIYSERPAICSDFSWDTCEKTTGEDAHKVLWEEPGEFMAWLEAKRPKAFQKYVERRAKLLRSRASARGKVAAETAAAQAPVGA